MESIREVENLNHHVSESDQADEETSRCKSNTAFPFVVYCKRREAINRPNGGSQNKAFSVLSPFRMCSSLIASGLSCAISCWRPVGCAARTVRSLYGVFSCFLPVVACPEVAMVFRFYPSS